MSQNPQNDKLQFALFQTGADIREFNVYCERRTCAYVMGKQGNVIRPRMNYHGNKPVILSSRRLHIFICSICGNEKRYRRNFIGTAWQRVS